MLKETALLKNPISSQESMLRSLFLVDLWAQALGASIFVKNTYLHKIFSGDFSQQQLLNIRF